ncbi:EAL and HDOD domain-containing protein [Marinobacterium sediminicola]|uniref:EAL and modified HD-GYP domain-containing signal transduction protein n=1 Tax=Marinobacterium sediminicola TaxID=518898 RepID=A0ABY1RVX2_9GAMM|nr:HDOD domain-containing protein [Marinobacterium sediminicola]ULG70553.1 HDOD domain-containing protein [Marinobacterium sediminicola]SMR69034.1 EAL and modified HD-GYP domain-containing signal transduction protein [Marinobacterium sediminicola]
MPHSVLMARQPIFDTRQKVIAYELLYRSNEGTNPLPLISGETASSRVILRSYTSIADAGNLRTLPAFINFSQQMLEAESLPSLSPREIVIEILEDCEVTPRLINAVERLHKAGFKLALDDFIYQPEFEPLLEMVHIVKLDIRSLSAIELRQQVELLRRFKVKLLAEKVETQEEYQLCLELGCEMFQGYFFSKPELLKGRKAAGSKLIITQLLSALSRPESDFAQLNDVLSRDPALSYKLLRLTNSAAFGLQRSVSSLQEALVYLGIDQLKKWASLIILADDYDKPSELVRQILLMARFCERLSEAYPAVDSGEAFMVGLLLHLDALMDQSQSDLLQQIDVTSKIFDALTERQGDLGLLLLQAEAFVQGNWESTDQHLTDKLQHCYLESLEWSRESMRLMDET